MSDVLLIGSGQPIGDYTMAAREPDVHVAWNKLRAQLQEIGGELQDLFDAPSMGAALDTVAVEVGISASGEVGIIVAKANVEVGTTITLTFARRDLD